MYFAEKDENDPVQSHFPVSRVLFNTKTSRGQNVFAGYSEAFGKMLFIDGEAQSSELDERVYHEALVHPAMMSIGAGARVLIAGGGEGATAREVLKWSNVAHVDMVEWDRELVDLLRTFEIFAMDDVWNDPRLHVHFCDIRSWKILPGQYDAIIIDLPDTFLLGTPLMNALCNSGAVVVCQAGAYDLLHRNEISQLCTALGGVAYSVPIPFFQNTWGFVINKPPAAFRALPFPSIMWATEADFLKAFTTPSYLKA